MCVGAPRKGALLELSKICVGALKNGVSKELKKTLA
jgi:hypothetical protein